MKKFDFFIIPFIQDGTVIGTILVVNLLALDLNASPSQIGIIGFAWGLTYAVGCAFTGRWADRCDRRVLLLAGASLFTVTVLLFHGCRNPGQIMVLNLFLGIACALFWPVFETLLHDDASEAGTRARMGLFNMGWTCGIATGTAGGGFLKEWGTHPALNLLAALSFANLLYLAWRIRDLPRTGTPPPAQGREKDMLAPPGAREGSGSQAPPCAKEGNTSHSPPCEGGVRGGTPNVPATVRVGFLYLAWIANFTLFFTGGVATQLFPKLARELSREIFPDGTIGLLSSCVTVAQGISFLVLARTARWHYRLGPLLGSQAASLVGLACLMGAHRPVGFAVGLGLLGLARGLSFSTSLYYALVASQERGVRTGLHETLIGAAFVLGPLLGGWIAEIQAHWLPLAVALRAPFQLCAVVTMTGIWIEYVLWRRMSQKMDPEAV